MRLLRQHKGFMLIESITALAISLLVVGTLTYCITSQFRILNQWEQRVNAHKMILLHLQQKQIPQTITIKNQKYHFQENINNYQVSVGNDVYQMEK